MTKILLSACFILVGVLAFTTGMLIGINKEMPNPIGHDKINMTNNTTNRTEISNIDSTGHPSEQNSEKSPGGSGHHVIGPVYYTYDPDFTHDYVAWYYDTDVGQYFSEYEYWDPNEGCYHD